MFPLIRNGDYVTIMPFDLENDLSRGDIILFEKEGQFCLHRFLKINNRHEIVTKGDNLPSFDPPIYTENILGKLVTIKRYNRVINLDSTLNKHLGRLIATMYPLTYPITNFLIRIYQFIYNTFWYFKRHK